MSDANAPEVGHSELDIRRGYMAEGCRIKHPKTTKPALGGLYCELGGTQSFEPDRNVPVFKGFSGFVFFGDTPGDTRCSLLGRFCPFFSCLPVIVPEHAATLSPPCFGVVPGTCHGKIAARPPGERIVHPHRGIPAARKGAI